MKENQSFFFCSGFHFSLQLQAALLRFIYTPSNLRLCLVNLIENTAQIFNKTSPGGLVQLVANLISTGRSSVENYQYQKKKLSWSSPGEKPAEFRMERLQPRPFGTDGRKSTHDFLSLYSHPTGQQEQIPPSQDNYLKTHDFLQPLERLGTKNSSEEEAIESTSVVQRPPPPAPPPSVEHILPGGIGTYTIGHISNFNQSALKPEGLIFSVPQTGTTDHNYENSMYCSSFTGNSFTLWEESAAKKGKTGKENMAQKSCLRGTNSGPKAPKWTPFERPSQSSSNNILTRHTPPSTSQTIGLNNDSFIDMIKSAKDFIQEEEEDDIEEFIIKTEAKPNQKDELIVKLDGKSTEQNPNTPRSKHSATEQRRRSKINDRFHMLRELIPQSDQKRDKASFLLEVIEYIHFLQEKVQKYEGSFRGWSPDAEEMMPRRTNSKPREDPDDQSGVVKNSSASEMFAGVIDAKNIITAPELAGDAHNPMNSDMSIATTYVGSDQNPRTIKYDSNSVSENLKAKGLTIEDGTISISSIYSQGLLHTLTKSLEGCGVDLSEASLSVQIEIGKQGNIRPKCTAVQSED